MTHTPGPWIADRDHDDYEIKIVGKPTWPCERFGVKGEWEVCKIDVDNEDAESNVALVEAAPDLLAALEEVLKYEGELDSQGFEDMDSPYYKARAAIRKAKAHD